MTSQHQEEVRDEISYHQQLTSSAEHLHNWGEYFLKPVSFLVKNSQSFAYEILSNLQSQKTEIDLFEKEDLMSFCSLIISLIYFALF